MPGPRRSHGCYRCRSKKVKCDEEQPACRRCINNALPCPGYRVGNELVFVDMSQSVEHKVLTSREKQRGPRSQAHGFSIDFRAHDFPITHKQNLRLQSSFDSARESSWALVKNSNDPTLYKPMSTDWQERALCRFFSDYIVNTDDWISNPGFLHNIPRIYNRTGLKGSVLRQAVTAVALSNFSNQVGSEDLSIKARKFYGRGLVELHRALSEERLESDDTLGGCLMLNMYEMFSGDKPPKSIWETHGDALGMLLRSRGTSSQFTSSECGGIARGAYRVIMLKNLLQRKAPGLETDLWEESMDSEAPWSQANLALNRIARLLPVADAVLREDPSVRSSSEHLLHAISLLRKEDHKFLLWSIKYGTMPLHNEPSENSNLTFSQRDSFANSAWNTYRAGRILLVQTLSSLATRALLHEDLLYLHKNMLQLQIFTKKELCAMVDDISGSTAIVLAELEGKAWHERALQGVKPISAYTSIFPLKVVLSVKTLTPEQRDYVSGQFQFIESTLGLKTAATIRKMT